MVSRGFNLGNSECCSDTVLHQDRLPDMQWLVATALDRPVVGEAGRGLFGRGRLGGWGSSGLRDWGKGEKLVDMIGGFSPKGAECWPWGEEELVGVRVVLEESRWVCGGLLAGARDANLKTMICDPQLRPYIAPKWGSDIENSYIGQQVDIREKEVENEKEVHF